MVVCTVYASVAELVPRPGHGKPSSFRHVIIDNLLSAFNRRKPKNVSLPLTFDLTDL